VTIAAITTICEGYHLTHLADRSRPMAVIRRLLANARQQPRAPYVFPTFWTLGARVAIFFFSRVGFQFSQ
jgi:hypothetical protein